MAGSAAVGAQVTEAIERYTDQDVCGNSFVNATRLIKEWLTVSQIHDLARKIWPDRPHPPQSGKVIWQYSPKVFCILATIGRPELIDQFKKLGITDGKLPFRTAEDLRRELVTGATIQHVEKVALRFFDEQWKFCVQEFELEHNRDYRGRHILPIVRKKPINEKQKGGTANLFDIEIPEEFVGPELRKKVPHLAYEVKDRSQVSRKHYHFALKVFEDSHDEVFENEKNAFIALQKHTGMVMYFGYFRQTSSGATQINDEAHQCQEWSGTRNILLEYSDMDMDEYFAEKRPPFLPQEIHRFWYKMAHVARALDGLHKLRSDDESEERVFKGWHADIKPANILLSQGVFKIADPGFAKIKLNDSENPEELISGGTWSFAAPEHPCYEARKVSQKIDIWSLACVFSVAATWVVNGHGALGDFQRIREDAIERCRQLPGNHLKLRGDAFHDGEKVLDEVTQWHNILQNSIRQTDSITDKILKLVDERMLCNDPGMRCDSTDLCIELENILQAAEMHHGLVPDTIMSSLRSEDKKASILSSERSQQQRSIDSLTKDHKSIDSMNREEKKEKRLDIVPKPTDSRLESLTGTMDRQLSNGSSPRQPPQPTRDPSSADAVAQWPLRSRGLQISSVLEETQTRQSNLGLVDGPRPAIDIEEMQRLQEYRWVRRQSRLLQKKITPNPTLKRYYDNRDIIFLIDNADSMHPRWLRVKTIAETLLGEYSGLDRDGIDVHFTMNQGEATKITKDLSKFASILQKERPSPTGGMRTDMEAALRKVFESHIAQLRSRKFSQQKQKPLTLLVLTDGLWQGTSSLGVVKNAIARFYQDVMQLIIGQSKRPVGIQFIRFGKDSNAIKRLNTLDNDLAKEKGIPDMVDTTPDDGDAWKMLLGAHIEEYDHLDSPEPGNEPTH